MLTKLGEKKKQKKIFKQNHEESWAFVQKDYYIYIDGCIRICIS